MIEPKSKVYALAIVAHPDDESFLFAGTSLKFAEEGKTVEVICATRGEKGADRLNRNLSEEQMAQMRSEELIHACEILKCGCEFLGFHDGALENTDFQTLVNDLVKKINHYQPEIILTFGREGISGHKDHIVVGLAALAASKQSDPKPKEVWLASIPTSAIHTFNEHLQTRKIHHEHFHRQTLKGVPDDQLLKIDIRKYALQKHEAIKAHESQYMPSFVLDTLQTQECFEVIKIV